MTLQNRLLNHFPNYVWQVNNLPKPPNVVHNIFAPSLYQLSCAKWNVLFISTNKHLSLQDGIGKGALKNWCRQLMNLK